MSIPPYPLAWPEGLPRTPSHQVTAGAFKTTLAVARKNVEDELRRFGNDTGKSVTDVVMTTNMAGLGPMPKDKGVAVWFTWDGAQRVFAVDRYQTLEANLQAIARIIEAHRTVMRHGGLNIVRQTFRGFTALPAPEHWSKVLEITATATEAEIQAAYRKQAKAAGTDERKLLTVNLARDSAIAERKG
jgi:hypothetical protein